MLEDITYYNILGIPLVVYIGAISLVFLVLTALVPILTKKQIKFLPFSWHNKLAALTVIFALIHALMAVLRYV
jgi:cytochrome b561